MMASVSAVQMKIAGGDRQEIKENEEMITKVYIRLSERIQRQMKAQTMTEYALILAAVAIVAYVTYQTMGNDIGSMVNSIDTALTTAA